jgi:hypothetical protein
LDDETFQTAPDLDDMIEQEAETVEPEKPPFGGLVAPEVARISPRRWVVTLKRPGSGEILVREQGDLNASPLRERVIEKVIKKLALGEVEGQTLADQLDQFLMETAASESSSNGQTAPIAEEVEYEDRIDPDNPEATGFYACGEKWQRRLTNFVARIEEERVIGDVDGEEESRRIRGTISVHGETSSFDMSTEQYSEQLRRAIIEAAGSKAEFLGSIDEIRTAISRNSTPVVRRYLTSQGWTADFSHYLVQGGHVDGDGLHETAGDDGVPTIDLSGHEKARWLGLLPLGPNQLDEVKRHMLADLMGINDPNVVSAMLAGVVLAIIMRPAGVGLWPLLWFQGLTGSGKSLLACMGMNFFGDFGPPGSGRYLSWNSTVPSLQSAGYDFRDALYVVDDYKREGIKHSNCVMILQSYADRTGRSRLRSDATMNTTRPIRGLLVSTGEDFPESNASGRGRAVVIRVSNPERDYDRVARCLEHCHLYRGWTAAFIASVIRNDLAKRFKTRVEHWQRVYLGRITGRTNDARIAANHACMAAAFELFAEFMGDVWDGANEAARAFAEVYVAGLVVEAAGAVEEETPARLFLSVLAEQIAYGRVRIKGIGPSIDSEDAREWDKIVGQLDRPGMPLIHGLSEKTDEHVIRLSIPLAMAAVQDHLRRQGR